MKITMYELLGLVKDGKAPKKVKYVNSIWEYDEETKDYFNDGLWLIYSMNSIGLTEREVEILEEEKKITKEDFIKERMDLDGITREQFNERYEVKECNCGMSYCKGFIAKERTEEEKKIPEKIKIDNEDRIQALSTGNFAYKVNQPTKNIIYKINEIIDYLDYLKSKGE